MTTTTDNTPEIRAALRAALEAANLNPAHDCGRTGAYGAIQEALVRLGDGPAIDYWASNGEWPDQLPTVAQVAHVVATVLGRHGVICPPIGQHDDAGTSAVCCVFYEGTDAARFFSLDHCFGYGANVYDDYEEMRAALTEIGVYHEQTWAKACVYPI